MWIVDRLLDVVKLGKKKCIHLAVASYYYLLTSSIYRLICTSLDTASPTLSTFWLDFICLHIVRKPWNIPPYYKTENGWIKHNSMAKSEIPSNWLSKGRVVSIHCSWGLAFGIAGLNHKGIVTFQKPHSQTSELTNIKRVRRNETNCWSPPQNN